MEESQRLRRTALRHMLSLFILVLSTNATIAGNLYKWTDATGKIHYSDTKPSTQNWERVGEGNVSIIPNDAPATLAADPQRAANSSSEDRNDDQTAQRAFNDRRVKLIGECERNRGVDCERQVDTELGAERIQATGNVIHQAPPSRQGAPSR